jgi:hypothetical protein
MQLSTCIKWLCLFICCLVLGWGVACERPLPTEQIFPDNSTQEGQSIDATQPTERPPEPRQQPTETSPEPSSPEKKTGLSRLPASLLKAKWIDVHTHCDAKELVSCDTGQCCNIARWAPVANAGGGAVVLSTEHFHVIKALGDALPEAIQKLDTENINEITSNSAKKAKALGFFISLDCWHNAKLTGDGKQWAASCKADVDRWVAQGAIGFKDHIGKQFNNEGEGADFTRWLGSWNRFNGFCNVPQGTPNPNQACMGQQGARYPALEPAWREVIRYIIEVKKLPILTHATSYYTASERCWDPLVSQNDKVRSCVDAGQAHLLSLAAWLKANVSAKARSRVIIGHLGFLQQNAIALESVLKAGLSSEIAVGVGFLAGKTCELRQLLSQYPKQIMFGTDINIDRECSIHNYSAWLHLLSGKWGNIKPFNICFAPQPAQIPGAELGTPQVTGCPYNVPPDLLPDLMKNNFLRLYQD